MLSASIDLIAGPWTPTSVPVHRPYRPVLSTHLISRLSVTVDPRRLERGSGRTDGRADWKADDRFVLSCASVHARRPAPRLTDVVALIGSDADRCRHQWKVSVNPASKKSTRY